MPCLTRTFDPDVGPLISLGIAKPGTLASAPKNSPIEIRAYIALVDTGADVTCISGQIAIDVGLVLRGKKDMASALTVEAANYYLADIALPFGDPGGSGPIQTQISGSIEIMEFQSNSQNYQVLLGRDIISRGYFSMSSWDNRFTICM